MIRDERTQQQADFFSPPAMLLDLPAPTYFEIPAASSHFLRTLLTESPMHAKTRPDTPTKAKDLGSICHCLILEPERSAQQIRVMPAGANRGSNAGKAKLVDFYCEALGRDLPAVDRTDEKGKPIADGKVLDAMLAAIEPDALGSEDIQISTNDEFEAAQRMRDSVMRKPLGKVLFDGGKSEVTILAARPGGGPLCKIRLDWLPDGHEVLVDLKSAADATEEGFGRAAASYGYNFQAAFYRAVESWYHGEFAPRKPFIFVVVENRPPYDSNFFVLDNRPEYVFGAKALAVADAQWKRALDIYEECARKDFWPGLGWNWNDNCYNVMPAELVLPAWSLK